MSEWWSDLHDVHPTMRPQAGRPRRWISGCWPALALLIVGAGVGSGACGPGEDPAVTSLRPRLAQSARLTDAELAQVRHVVGRLVAGKTVKVQDEGGVRTLDEDERRGLFEVLGLPVGVFDEGLQQVGAESFRVLNGPAASDNTEIEAVQRLWIDVVTLLPRRYEFSYAFPGTGRDRIYEIVIAP